MANILTRNPTLRTALRPHNPELLSTKPQLTPLRPFKSNSTSTKPTSKKPSSPLGHSPTPPPFPSLLTLLRESPPRTRYTVLTFLALLGTAETSFWLRVIYEKFIRKDEGDGLWERYLVFLKGVRGVWLGFYWGWWGEGLWGL
ncbi:hypothetical protein BU24DRAFT_407843 [Aaosphaeria arxii CBS 175.79]|uniref:Uncharacterized protein n=1 Tax=Aaosphaeria arxii CBS 175.79 TaxID=1450172 RepID=A0A6A5XY39_9PLEO|nr:uncharacterized protein BU24DRAFT_407843 [Aaosphaeria arxii CBS 175.79]KAF2017876.1 hypothetical protein BU24DRAFT_407843 [Aaosphaeria arxii CBS 175.79]